MYVNCSHALITYIKLKTATFLLRWCDWYVTLKQVISEQVTLFQITRQPIVYLKEILNEVCNYNLKNPHKNMWELKPEYRHYKQDVPMEVKEDKNSSDSD